MLVAIGAVHICNFVEGRPLRFSGLVFIAVVFVLLIVLGLKKISFEDEAIVIKPVMASKRVIPYKSVKSVEYIETKISAGRGIRPKVRNIRFNLADGTSIQLSETEIPFKKSVNQLLEAYDNGKFKRKVISPATRELLLNAIQ